MSEDQSTGTEVATVTEAELAELDALDLGDDPTEGSGPMLPQLKVNYSAEDEAEDQLPLGHFVVTGMETPVYAKKVHIRPLMQHFSYVNYDEDEQKVVCRTVKNTSFKKDFIDTNGGVRCGRPDSKTWKDMDKDQRKPYDGISANREVAVIVSYEGKDKHGNKAKVENVPAILRLKGVNFMGFDEQFFQKIPKGRKLRDFWVELSLKKEKNGQVTYYLIQYDPDLNNPAPLDRDTVDTIKHFAELVEDENANVKEQHNKALREKNSDASTYDAVAGNDLDGDFNEED